jgi:hypothetical protein
VRWFKRRSCELVYRRRSWTDLRSGRAHIERAICLVVTLLFCAAPGRAASISESNKITALPKYADSATQCSASLMFKPVVNNDQHGYIVVKGPDGKELELRGGPSKGGGTSTWVPGRISPSTGDQPTGNPFNCSTTHSWGVIVPYVGPHGVLGTDATGNKIYSPDGNVPKPTATVSLGRGAQPDVCKMANCVMTILQAQGKSCKLYTLGVGALRNSNTVVSMALAACGLADPLPKNISATGWGNNWEDSN